jgi:hypothetical protein
MEEERSLGESEFTLFRKEQHITINAKVVENCIVPFLRLKRTSLPESKGHQSQSTGTSKVRHVRTTNTQHHRQIKETRNMSTGSERFQSD